MNTKIKVVMACGLIAASVLVPLTVVSAGEQSGFVGSWQAEDCLDESDEVMKIRGGGGHYAVILRDSACSGCCPECAEEDWPPCKAVGAGTTNEDGTILTVKLKVTTVGGPIYECHGAVVPAATFTYDPTTDTLVDYLAGCPTTWTRVE